MYVYIKNKRNNSGYYNLEDMKEEELARCIETQFLPRIEDDFGDIDGHVICDLFFRSPSDDAEQVLKELQKYATHPLCIINKVKYRGCVERKGINMKLFTQTHLNVEEKEEKSSFSDNVYVYYDEWSYSIIPEQMKKELEKLCSKYPKFMNIKREKLKEEIRSLEYKLRKIDIDEDSLSKIMKNINNEGSYSY